MRILIAIAWVSISTISAPLLANDPPELSVQSYDLELGDTLEFTVAPSDPQGVVPGVFLSDGPSSATLEDNGDGTRNFNWTADQAGTVELEFTVMDGQDINLREKVKSTVSVDDSPAAPYQSSKPVMAVKDEFPTIGRSLPDFGQPYAETTANSIVTRVTGSENFGRGAGNVSHQYSKRRAWNSDETLISVGEKIIDAETFAPVLDYIPLTSERVWSHLNPDRMYGFSGSGGKLNRLLSFDISSGDTSLVFEFSQFQKCTIGDWEGDISDDDRYLLAACRYSNGSGKALSLDLVNQEIMGSIDLPNKFNWGGFSHSGRYVLIEINQGFQGNMSLTRYSPSLQDPQVIARYPYHGDFGVDSNGDDVYVMIDGKGIHYVVLKSGEFVQLGNNGESGWGGGHLSCRNVKTSGSCFYSKVSGDGIGEVDLDPNSPNFELWGLSRSNGGGYDSQPKASVSPSGRQIIFASDWYGSSSVNAFVVEHFLEK